MVVFDKLIRYYLMNYLENNMIKWLKWKNNNKNNKIDTQVQGHIKLKSNIINIVKNHIPIIQKQIGIKQEWDLECNHILQ